MRKQESRTKASFESLKGENYCDEFKNSWQVEWFLRKHVDLKGVVKEGKLFKKGVKGLEIKWNRERKSSLRLRLQQKILHKERNYLFYIQESIKANERNHVMP